MARLRFGVVSESVREGLDQIRSDLPQRREQFGLSYFVAGEDGLPALAEIASGL